MRPLVVRSSELDRWDVKYIAHRDWAWSTPGAEPFGRVAVRRVEPADKTSADFGSVRLASIHFDGSMSRRAARAEDLSGRLFFAYPGDLVFSKIDARNGAIGVVPEELGRVAFTTEYPIYDTAAPGRLRAEFVKLLCRTSSFRARVNALAVGHSGRKRVSPEAMEELLIPAPDLAVQDLILSQLGQQLREADDLEHQARVLEGQIDTLVLEVLGIEHKPFERLKQPFVVRAADLGSWSVLPAMMVVEGISEEPVGSWRVNRLGDPGLGIVSYGVTKSPSNRPGQHARPYLRVANVQAGWLDLSVVKCIDVPDREMAKYRLEEGDLLLCEGNSVELVGRPALWRGEIADCVHQNHVIKVRLNRTRLDPEFVMIYMNTPPARLYMLRRAKRTTNLASINSTDVADFPIPVPPLDLQRAIAREVAALREQAEALHGQALQVRREAHSEAERRIFEGTI